MLRFALLLPAVLVSLPVLAQSPPRAMFGVWAPSAESCTEREGVIADSRLLIARRTIESFVTTMEVQRWQRVGETWRAQAIVTGEEGGEEPSRERVRIDLRLLPDGRLSRRNFPADPELFVRCPPGVQVR